MAGRSANPIPPPVRKLFWDLDPRSLRLDRDEEMIIGRVLASGPWETVKWLRSIVGDDAIRQWIEEHDGRGLSPRQLRYWQLVLGIPAGVVDAWLRSDRRRVWDRRGGTAAASTRRMRGAKVAISLAPEDLKQVDQLVEEGMFPSRSKFIQEAVIEKLERLLPVHP